MGGDKNKGDTTKTQSQQSHSTSPKDPLDEPPPQPPPAAAAAAPFISTTPLYVPLNITSSPFDQQFETTPTIIPKRPRYATSTQWKLLPSPSQHQIPPLAAAESTPSPTTKPAASSSDTPSSPSAAASGGDTTKPEAQHHQFRKGKYVSPVWKPNEMLWLARAWRAQYQIGAQEHVDTTVAAGGGGDVSGQSSRGKTRAEKDKEVAEFLQKHGVNRDAKTAGTKWDNMLGEFRKVYEWERGGERDQIGKSYFRLSPYERKLHRLPASFDEEVFQELSQFMGSRMRSSHGGRGTPAVVTGDDSRAFSLVSMAPKSLPPPHPFKEEEFSLQARGKQIVTTATSSKEIRRIGKVKLTWEESMSLWGEEGESNGRIKVEGSSFLNVDELTFFDESMVACNMESFEDGPLKGFSVDRFESGTQVKVVGRRKSFSSGGLIERFQLPSTDTSIRSFSPLEYQDPSEYYISCLRVPPPALPTLFELSWYIQEPPPEDLRFPLRQDIHRDLPHGKDSFFTTSTEPLDCRTFFSEIVNPIIRPNPSITAATASSRDSFIGLYDDCINRIIAKFCSLEMIITRKPSNSFSDLPMQDQWPNLTGFVRNFCLWRGEEVDRLREGQMDPSSSLVDKTLWTYMDIPYILGYYAVGYLVTFCALTRSQDRVLRTDLYTLDLSSPVERLKALIPCYRIAGILTLLGEKCSNNRIYSDFERLDINGNVIETTPNTVIRYYPSKRKWSAVKEIYDYLDQRIPHAEFIDKSAERELALVFKPRGVRVKPANCEELVEALKCVTKALVALHDLSFMHRDLGWDKVARGRLGNGEGEWFVWGFEEAAGAPQIYPVAREGGGRHAPEMARGMHGVKVDVWGVGEMVRDCGLAAESVPKMLRELQNRCLEVNPEQRPTAADCYHRLLQVQSSMQSAASGGDAPPYLS